MKKIFIVFVLLLQGSILSQTNFIRQITSGDFDARNPFIYKDEYGFYNNFLFFELHNVGYSNIYYKRYNSDFAAFEDTVALTTENSNNINPSYHSSFGVLYQTNKNGNWDIGFVTDSNGVFGIPELLTNSVDDEIDPIYFERTEDYQRLFYDTTSILFKRNNDILFLNYDHGQILEEVIFDSDSQFSYSEFVGLENNFYWGNKGYYIYAIESDNIGNKKIVRKYKSYNGLVGDKIILKDNCDCDNLSLQYSTYNTWGLFYTDSSQGQNRYFVYEDLMSSNPINFNANIEHEGNLSSFDVYYFLDITEKNNQIKEPDLYKPHTYLVEDNGITSVRVDISDLGIWDRDSLIQISVSNSNLAIGSVGVDGFANLVYSIWEDSTDGHIQLFGTPTHIQYGAVEDESYTNDFILYQNYPNPFNPETKIEYKLLQASDVKLNVTNILGEKVFEQNFVYQTTGNYKVNFDGKNLPSGVYVYSIYTDENRLSRKMLLMK